MPETGNSGNEIDVTNYPGVKSDRQIISELEPVLLPGATRAEIIAATTPQPAKETPQKPETPRRSVHTAEMTLIPEVAREPERETSQEVGHGEQEQPRSSAESDGSESMTIPDLTTEEKNALRTFKESGISIHEAPKEIKLALAKLGFYTTTEPIIPGTFGDFRKERATERELEKLRENTKRALRTIPEYQNEERLGYRVADLFESTEVTIDENKVGVIPDPTNDVLKGTVFAEEVNFTIADKGDASLLFRTLQKLLRTGVNEDPCSVNIPVEKEGKFVITVNNLTEYANRALGNAIEQMVAEDDYNTTGTKLPKRKRSLRHWKEGISTFITEAGEEKETEPEPIETFHPKVEKRLERRNEAYKTTGTPEDKEYREKTGNTEILGTDPAVVFQIIRNKLRQKIRALRGADHFNLEQNPDKTKRLLIEEDVEITRDIITSPDGAKLGPESPRAYHESEKSMEWLREQIAEKKAHKLLTTARLIAKGLGAGAETILEGLVDLVPMAKHYRDIREEDRRLWLARIEQVAENQAKIYQQIDLALAA